ncbi:MAG: HesA/MoeB/ThiF family protein [Deltaproteobacteria bacterium]|nr:HesA/MoeB/ThiF family protein [Deltaproteobacteria bacterium]
MRRIKTLAEAQIDRYSRQILLAEIGGQGQKKLLGSRVTVVGAGGLGCPASQALAAAGIGTIRIIDADRVELSNLPRQFLHHTKDVGRYKVDSIQEKIEAMNPDVTVEAVRRFVDKDNIADLLSGSDYVIEACDGQAAKFLVNDACVHLGIPFTIAGVVQFHGQIISVTPGKTSCLRCLFREPAPEDPQNSCSGAGVIGAAPGMTGMIQANEAIKSITGAGKLHTDKLLMFNLIDCSFDVLDIAGLPRCAACAQPREPFYKTFDYGACVTMCHLDSQKA